jgi:hypothetical protein
MATQYAVKKLEEDLYKQINNIFQDILLSEKKCQVKKGKIYTCK